MRWAHLTDGEKRAIIAALEHRRASPERDQAPEILAGMHPHQRAFVEDSADVASALCSRRAGKTHALAALVALGQMRHPKGLSLYLAETVGKARELLWDGALAGLSERHHLGAKLWRPDNLYITWPNGHRTWLGGYSSVAEVEKYRGAAFQGVVIVDEAQSCAHLERLTQEVLLPGCADYRTPLRYAGTPGLVAAGMFWRATAGDLDWSRHRWTLRDNDRFPRWAGSPAWQAEAEAYLAAVRKQNNWTEATPAYQREYLGQWVEDAGNLVFPFRRELNGWDGQLPEGGQATTVLSVDLATTGTTAYVVASIVSGEPRTYLRHCETHTGMSLPRVCAVAEQLRQRWTAHRVVVDAGGLGKAFVDEMRERHQLPATAAEKRDKAGFAYALAGDLAAGNTVVDARQCRPLLDEWAGLVWDDARTGWDAALPDHASDAALYAWRALRPYYRPQEDDPPIGSPDWHRREADARRRETQRRVRERQRGRR